MWERIKAEFRDWSLPHFLFDGFLSLLIGYAISLRFDYDLHQVAILTVLVCGTITSLILMLMRILRERASVKPFDLQEFEDRARAAEIERQQAAIKAVRVQLVEYAKVDGMVAESDDFWDWYRTVSSYLSGVSTVQIVAEFHGIADSTKCPRSCRHFLIGLSTNLAAADLREPGKIGAPW
jgi:hypothetical protein